MKSICKKIDDVASNDIACCAVGGVKGYSFQTGKCNITVAWIINTDRYVARVRLKKTDRKIVTIGGAKCLYYKLYERCFSNAK